MILEDIHVAVTVIELLMSFSFSESCEEFLVMQKCCPYQFWKHTLKNKLTTEPRICKINFLSLPFPDFPFVLSSLCMNCSGLAVLYHSFLLGCSSSLKRHRVSGISMNRLGENQNVKINLRIAKPGQSQVHLSYQPVSKCSQ